MPAHLSNLDFTVFALFLPHRCWREHSQQVGKQSITGWSYCQVTDQGWQQEDTALTQKHYKSCLLFLTETITLLFILQVFCTTVSVKCDRRGSHLPLFFPLHLWKTQSSENFRIYVVLHDLPFVIATEVWAWCFLCGTSTFCLSPSTKHYNKSPYRKDLEEYFSWKSVFQSKTPP